MIQIVADDPEQAPDDLEKDLTAEEIRRRLRLVNPELAKDLLDVARAQVQSEVVRHGRLDTKATSIVTAGGISITVAFSVAGSLSAAVAGHGWLIAMFAAAGVAGLATVLLGVRALLVRGGYAEVSDQAVFKESTLELADSPKGVDDLKDRDGNPDRKEINAFGAAIYKQYLTAHLWDVYVKDHKQIDAKAVMVKHAQVSFVIFLTLIFACEMSLFGVIYLQDARETARAAAAATKRAERREALAATSAAMRTSGEGGSPSAVGGGGTSGSP